MTNSEEVPEFNTDHLNVDLEFPEASTLLLLDVFGGFNNRAGRLIRRPVQFLPVARQLDVTKWPEAHYRQLNTQVRSRNAADKGQPLRQATRDVVGNLVGTWRLTLREYRPEFVGMLLIQAVSMEAVQHE